MYEFQNSSDYMIQTYLETSKVIAVVGLSDREETASNRISRVMQELGYQIIPVNPKLVGQKILGETAYARLQDIPISVDIVNVFRLSEFLPGVARDFIETDAKIFWAQLGLQSQEAEELLRAAGCDHIVMNRCIKRGNSGSEKTSLAKKLPNHFGRRTFVISQDLVRREMLKEKVEPDNLSIFLTETFPLVAFHQ